VLGQRAEPDLSALIRAASFKDLSNLRRSFCSLAGRRGVDLSRRRRSPGTVRRVGALLWPLVRQTQTPRGPQAGARARFRRSQL